MNCDSYKIIHLLNGELSPGEVKKLEEHILTCNDCQKELEHARKVMLLIEQIETPEPGENMELRFQATLQHFKEEQFHKQERSSAFWSTLYQRLISRPAYQFAYSFLLILVSVSAMYLLMSKPANDDTKQEIVKLSTEIKDMKQAMMLSLIENPSAAERIKAVGYTNEMTDADSQVIEALLTTLNEDPNTNVRLVALDALLTYSNSTPVREGLVQSITTQQSPLLQAALADAMIKLQEKKSVQPLREILKKNGAENPARQKIEKAITQLSI